MPVVWDFDNNQAAWVFNLADDPRPAAVRIIDENGREQWGPPGAEVPPPPPEEPRQLLEVRPWGPEAFRPALPKKATADGIRGESLFKLILSGIKEVYDVDAVIAGGAVRDLAVGVEKDTYDVDVFIPMDWKAFKEHSDQLGWEIPPAPVKAPYKDMKIKSTRRAHGRVQGMMVDLVFMEEPLTPDKVDKFPINAQKCVWTLEQGLQQSLECLNDIVNKTFTISPTITDKETIKRIREKVDGWKKRGVYKDWKVVEPDIKEWWELKEEPKAKKTKKNSWTFFKEEDGFYYEY